MRDYTTLQAVWFVLICVLWLGYFVLEGFDFGVGMLLRRVGRTPAERRAVLHSIGPLWDGNEVWLIVAGGATFAAFPEWYATLFSGFYLALLLILLALIARGVAFEFWGKHDTARWRGTWEWAIVLGSLVPALLWGVGWANIVDGTPIDAERNFTGDLFDLLGPYALLGGITTLLLFLSHGAIFLALRTRGELEARALAAARTVSAAAAVAAIAFLVWTIARHGAEIGSVIFAIGAGTLVIGAAAMLQGGRPLGWAFGLSAGAIALLFCSLFADLFPNVMVSDTATANSITLAEAASTSYTLTVMTVVAAALVPVVLLYQGWTYWVFRHRVGPEDFGDVRGPLDVVAPKRAE
jgi:cytochrome bd ubiquinol oxidase subunit II